MKFWRLILKELLSQKQNPIKQLHSIHVPISDKLFGLTMFVRKRGHPLVFQFTKAIFMVIKFYARKARGK